MTSTSWTPRRRLLTAVACGIPDRVPICTYELAGYNSAAWENNDASYARLMARIRQDGDCTTMWDPASTATFLATAHSLPIDRRTCRTGSHTRTTSVIRTPKGPLSQITEQDDAVHTTWITEPWCKSIDDVDKALSIPYVPAAYDVCDLPRLQKEVADRGIIMATLADPALTAAELMSFEEFTVWAFEHPEHFARTTAILAERIMENLRRQLDACGVDLYRIVGPEYFTPPYLSPERFKRMVVPHVSAMADYVHSRGGKVRVHCHGKIARVLDLIFETHPDGIDPCEPPPDGDLDLNEVKRRCGEHNVSVWGNTELRVLENGSPTEIREAVKRSMEQAKEGGGYILMPTASPIDVPLSAKTEGNYYAWLDAGLEFGGYG
ncbi:MAG: hypothetical protein NTU53_08960 [Planctomycetota bacterium]|nr:hypothetical protein [Planctomycetota bacterium]